MCSLFRGRSWQFKKSRNLLKCNRKFSLSAADNHMPLQPSSSYARLYVPTSLPVLRVFAQVGFVLARTHENLVCRGLDTY